MDPVATDGELDIRLAIKEQESVLIRTQWISPADTDPTGAYLSNPKTREEAIGSGMPPRNLNMRRLIGESVRQRARYQACVPPGKYVRM